MKKKDNWNTPKRGSEGLKIQVLIEKGEASVPYNQQHEVSTGEGGCPQETEMSRMMLRFCLGQLSVYQE